MLQNIREETQNSDGEPLKTDNLPPKKCYSPTINLAGDCIRVVAFQNKCRYPVLDCGISGDSIPYCVA